MARKNSGRIIPAALAVAASLVLSGCSKERAYTSPNFGFIGGYAGAKTGVPVLLENLSWWQAFQDPVLNALVDRALTENLSLALARERVIEAQANEGGVPDRLSLSPSAGISREKDISGSALTRSEASLGLSWLLDPYGARRSQMKALRARVEAADAEVDAARLLIIYNTANAYVDLRYRQRLLQVRLSELRSRTQTLSLTRTLVERNSATRLDLVRAEARLADVQATIPRLRAAIQSSKYQIATLVGASPGSLDVDLDAGAMQPQPRMSTRIGIPVDLLRNRPDIRIAERLYYASVAEIGEAEAALYPSLSLGGAITLAAIHGGPRGSEYYFGPTLRLPALPGGARRAAVVARESRARQALNSWQSTVLEAIAEVESALVEYAGATSAVYGSQKAVRLYREAVSLTRDLVSRDAATISELLLEEANVADADATLAENIRLMSLSFIQLNVSLGSGNSFEGKSGEIRQEIATKIAD